MRARCRLDDGPVAIDIMRAVRLEQQGYRVWTQSIPASVTPKNRLLLGAPIADLATYLTERGSRRFQPTGPDHALTGRDADLADLSFNTDRRISKIVNR